MPKELRVRRPLVDRATRSCNEGWIAEVALERLVVGAESASAADPGESDDMRVVGFAQAGPGDFSLFTNHLRRRDLPSNAGPLELYDKSPRLLQAAQLCGQVPAHHQAAAALLEPIQDGGKIGMGPASEDEARQVGVHDHAHGQPPKKRRSSSRKKSRYPGGALRMLPCSSSSSRWIVASPFFRSK